MVAPHATHQLRTVGVQVDLGTFLIADEVGARRSLHRLRVQIFVLTQSQVQSLRPAHDRRISLRTLMFRPITRNDEAAMQAASLPPSLSFRSTETAKSPFCVFCGGVLSTQSQDRNGNT